VNPLRGFPGHPSHPPLTDATIGAYTFATVAAILSKAGVAEGAFAQAWWLALIVGAASSLLTVSTGFLDWLQISSGSPLWRTATLHAVTNAVASVFFVLAIAFGHDDYVGRAVQSFPGRTRRSRKQRSSAVTARQSGRRARRRPRRRCS
jgi:uncharacterized membrane protein